MQLSKWMELVLNVTVLPHHRNSELLCVKCVSSKRGKSLNVLSKPGLSNYSVTTLTFSFLATFPIVARFPGKKKEK